MKFDTSLYQAHALLTESCDTEKINERIMQRRSVVYNALASFIDIANVLDVNKKQVFYGKNFVAEQDVDNGSQFTRQEIRSLHAIIGIATEAGELVQCFLDRLNGNKDEESARVNFMEELGDIEWYQAVLRHSEGIDENHERNANLNKLLVKRYRNLKFDEGQANTRDLDAELKALANPDVATDEQLIELKVGDTLLDNYSGSDFKVVFANDVYALLANDSDSAKLVASEGNSGYINPMCAINNGSLCLVPRFGHGNL